LAKAGDMPRDNIVGGAKRAQMVFDCSNVLRLRGFGRHLGRPCYSRCALVATPKQRRADMPRPIALTDEQLSAVMAAAQPLAPADRSAFLEDVAAALTALPIVGDGAVNRVVREVQSRYFRPELDPPRYGGRWAPR
jgi:hypothetical protein